MQSAFATPMHMQQRELILQEVAKTLSAGFIRTKSINTSTAFLKHSMQAAWTVTVALFVIRDGCVAELASFVPQCHRSALLDFDSCLTDAVEMLIRPRLAKGLPALSLPAIDPLGIPCVHLVHASAASNYSCELTNFSVYGLSNFEVLRHSSDVVHKHLTVVSIQLPLVSVESSYEVNGWTSHIPLRGKGQFFANFTSITADLQLGGQLISKNGSIHYSIRNITMEVVINETYGNFENIYPEHLGSISSEYLNENWLQNLADIQPVVQMVAAQLIQNTINGVLDLFTYDQLFPW